jgi:hypothetical protein
MELHALIMWNFPWFDKKTRIMVIIRNSTFDFVTLLDLVNPFAACPMEPFISIVFNRI